MVGFSFLKKGLLSLMLFGAFFLLSAKIYAEDPTPTPTPTSSPTSAQSTSNVGDCASNNITVADCPNYLQKKISELQGQDKTLSSQIAISNSQINLTEAKIAKTADEVAALEGDIDITKTKISSSEGTLENTSVAFMGRAKAVYQVGAASPWQVLLTSSTLENFFTRLKYLKIVQLYDKKNIYAAEQAKVNYANQQDILEDKKKQQEELSEKLKAYTDQLNQDKEAKKKLLTETQGNEATYQKLLSAAKAQLAGFSNFVAAQGGASLLSGQTSCDSWGCYYNQRDSSWGGMALNGTQYTLASDGCLVTSMAMIFTHYGRKITPVDINSNSSNFASYYPAYLLFTISAGGSTASRVGQSLDSVLSGGDPAVVGVNAYGGTHFVVIKSGSGGNYIMHDPYVPNGHDVNFTDHYSVGSIFSVQKVVFL
jgi:peptidoglycan hydrolase CwlO-like protein